MQKYDKFLLIMLHQKITCCLTTIWQFLGDIMEHKMYQLEYEFKTSLGFSNYDV